MIHTNMPRNCTVSLVARKHGRPFMGVNHKMANCVSRRCKRKTTQFRGLLCRSLYSTFTTSFQSYAFITNGCKRFLSSNSSDPRQRVPLNVCCIFPIKDVASLVSYKCMVLKVKGCHESAKCNLCESIIKKFIQSLPGVIGVVFRESIALMNPQKDWCLAHGGEWQMGVAHLDQSGNKEAQHKKFNSLRKYNA